jgi:histidinol phosphatase-like enzyme (inositol monophosphatase family)
MASLNAVDDGDIDLAQRLADAAASVTRRYFRQDLGVEAKDDLTPVTIADREAESAIRELLAAERPGDGIVGEEHGNHNAEHDRVWVIDPIDGTKSFMTGRAIFGTLIALMVEGSPVLGVIDQPVQGERWVGAKGHPTLFNGQPATTRTCPSPAAAVVATTTPEMFKRATDRESFERLTAASAIQLYGGDCYLYGQLACGWLDLVVEAGMNLYDYAALAPVVTGAGGVISDWQGAPLTGRSDGRVLAAGDPACHETAIGLLSG